MVVLVLALVAGGTWIQALALGFAMLGFQFAYGAFNDLFDQADDARVKPYKPIPAGRIGPGAAAALGVVSAVAGLSTSAWFGGPTLVVGALILSAGLAYDAFLKRGPWSWAPYAVEFPLVPAYAWLAITSELPPGYAVILPAAMGLGLALNLANGIVDVERDRATGAATAAVLLGRSTALVILRAVDVAVLSAAWASLYVIGALHAGAAVLLAVASGVLVVGATLSAASAPATRERGWQAHVLGAATLAAGWLIGIVGRNAG